MLDLSDSRLCFANPAKVKRFASTRANFALHTANSFWAKIKIFVKAVEKHSLVSCKAVLLAWGYSGFFIQQLCARAVYETDFCLHERKWYSSCGWSSIRTNESTSFDVVFRNMPVTFLPASQSRTSLSNKSVIYLGKVHLGSDLTLCYWSLSWCGKPRLKWLGACCWR